MKSFLSPKPHILDSYWVWYSSFWSGGLKTTSTWKFWSKSLSSVTFRGAAPRTLRQRHGTSRGSPWTSRRGSAWTSRGGAWMSPSSAMGPRGAVHGPQGAAPLDLDRRRHGTSRGGAWTSRGGAAPQGPFGTPRGPRETNFETKIIKFGWFLGPHDQNKLQHTPSQSKIWGLEKKLWDDPFNVISYVYHLFFSANFVFFSILALHESDETFKKADRV